MTRQLSMSATITSPFASGYASSGVCISPGPRPATPNRPYCQTIRRVERTIIHDLVGLLVRHDRLAVRGEEGVVSGEPSARRQAALHREPPSHRPGGVDDDDPPVLPVGDHEIAREGPGGYGRGVRSRIRRRLRGSRGRIGRAEVGRPRAHGRRYLPGWESIVHRPPRIGGRGLVHDGSDREDDHRGDRDDGRVRLPGRLPMRRTSRPHAASHLRALPHAVSLMTPAA